MAVEELKECRLDTLQITKTAKTLSQRPTTEGAIMEIVVCYCLKCKVELGRFRNSWNGIGNTYFSPVYPILTYDDGFDGTGDIHQAAAGSQIENGFLQDLACKGCRTIVGLRCDSAPEGHMLTRNQLILRLSCMSVVSEGTGEKAKVSVLKSFPLTHPGAKKPTASRRASTAQPAARGQSQSLQSEIVTRQISNSTMMPPPAKEPASDLAIFNTRTDNGTSFNQRDIDRITRVENAISSQQKDTDRITGAIDRLERNMESLKDVMKEICTELGATRQAQTTAGAEDLVDGLRQQIDSIAEKSDVSAANLTRSFNDDLVVIAEDIVKVGQKANEMDALKEELQRMNAKLLHLEATFHHQETHQESLLEGSLQRNRAVTEHDPKLQHGRRPLVLVEINSRAAPRTESGAHHEVTLPSPMEVSEAQENVSNYQLKRKRGSAKNDHQAESTETASSPELPSKRRKRAWSMQAGDSVGIENGPREMHPQAQKPGREVIEIPSSEHATSPILDQNKVNGIYTFNEQDEDINIRPKPKSVASLSASKRPRKTGRPNEMSSPLVATMNKVLASASRLETRQRRASTAAIVTTSQAPTSAPRPDSQNERANAESRNTRRKSDINYGRLSDFGRLRDTNGLLLTPDGKVDGRSLRYKKGASDQNLQTPNRSGATAEAPGGQIVDVESQRKESSSQQKSKTTARVPFKPQPTQISKPASNTKSASPIKPTSATKPISAKKSISAIKPTSASKATPGPARPRSPSPDELGDTILPSIEIEDADNVFPAIHPQAPTPEPQSSSESKPYACGICGRRYKYPTGLSYHKQHSGCKENERGDEVPEGFVCEDCGKKYKQMQSFNNHKCKAKAKETNGKEKDAEARKRELEERERLVKKTMEREMSRAF